MYVCMYICDLYIYIYIYVCVYRWKGKEGENKDLPHGAEGFVRGRNETHARVFGLVVPVFEHFFGDGFGEGAEGWGVGVAVGEVRFVFWMGGVGALAHVDDVPVAAWRGCVSMYVCMYGGGARLCGGSE